MEARQLLVALQHANYPPEVGSVGGVHVCKLSKWEAASSAMLGGRHTAMLRTSRRLGACPCAMRVPRVRGPCGRRTRRVAQTIPEH